MITLRKLVTSRFVQTLVGAAACYAVADYFLPQEFVNALLAALTLCLATAVSFLYVPVAWTQGAFLKSHLASRDRLVLGIILSWLARLVLSGVAVINLLLGPSQGFNFNQSPWFGYIFTAILVAAVFHITAPVIAENEPPYQNWKSVLVALCAGFLLAGIVFGIGISHLQIEVLDGTGL